MMIISPELAEKKRILPTRWTLQTATGESVKGLDITIANFRMAEFSFVFQVADIPENIILGKDIMTECAFKLA